MRYVRAVRDTPVADYSAPGITSMRCVAYHPLMAISPCILVLVVSDSKQSLWRCGQLPPYVGMGSLGTHLHRDSNVIVDAVKIFPCVPSTCAQNAIPSLLIIHIIPSRQICVAIDNPSLIPSVSCLTTGWYLCNYVRTADHVSQTERFQSNSCRCVSQLYKFSDRIQGTWGFRYCGELQG